MVAIVGAAAVAIVETETIFPAAYRTRPMLVAEKPGLDTQLWQNFLPPTPSALDRVHRRECLALAYAMSRDLTHARVAGLGSDGPAPRQPKGGHRLVFSLNFAAAHPSLMVGLRRRFSTSIQRSSL